EKQAGQQGEQKPGEQGEKQAGQQGGQKPGRGQGQSGATGMHSGDVAGGAAPKERGKVDTGKVDLPPQAAASAAKLASLGRALHEARRQIRDGEIKPDLLKAMGMTATQFRNFVKEYSQRYERLRRDDAGPAEVRPGAVEMVGTDTVQKGTADTAMAPTQQDSARGSQQDRQLQETRSRKVSPEYQKKLEAYLRTVSEETTTDAPK
ncbi:MAG: hypothetical protein K8S55_15505, partial [Phycisphaerae bacterium]|nr:hypothetical protein [Phycisphaerae bacterium]